MYKYYSEQVPKILNFKNRGIIGREIISVLEHHLGSLSRLTILDYGCSTGVITHMLSRKAKRVVGLDIDAPAIKYAKKEFENKNTKFFLAKGLKTNFRDASFDVIIANQIYNFVENDTKLMTEIYRLLKPGGVCYFGARNKYAIIEPQYDLPFLSWLPKYIANKLVVLTNKGDQFVGVYRSYFGLKKLVNKFTIYDFTLKILANPRKYGFVKLYKYKKILKLIPFKLIEPFIPNYIWILEKAN